MIRINFFVIFALLLFGSCSQDNEKPNVIIIMADDLGYQDLGCYGNQEINTPNIDFLSSNGIRFLDYHSSGTVCSPTRAALMTGRYQQRSGIEGVVTAANHRHTGLDLEEFTMAEFFQNQGYTTALVGKWHLGYDTAFSPLNNGFDYFKGFVSGNVDYHSHVDQEGYFDWWENKDTLNEPGYTTDLFTETAVSFILENKDKPFFLYLAHEAPHYPYQGRNDPAIRKPGPDFKIPGAGVDIKRAYKEMIEVMDEGIGKVYLALEENGLLPQTLIWFCSDNGASANGSNGHLKGFKGSVWEGGHRVPAIAFWENKIQPGLSNTCLTTMDIFPTLVEMIKPQDIDKFDFDGLGFTSVLLNQKTDNSFNIRPLVWRFNNRAALRIGSWKYVRLKEQEFLFNLEGDLSEKDNLRDNYPEIVDSLKLKLEGWEKEMEQYVLRTK